jgi:hypothetical protein
MESGGNWLHYIQVNYVLVRCLFRFSGALPAYLSLALPAISFLRSGLDLPIGSYLLHKLSSPHAIPRPSCVLRSSTPFTAHQPFYSRAPPPALSCHKLVRLAHTTAVPPNLCIPPGFLLLSPRFCCHPSYAPFYILDSALRKLSSREECQFDPIRPPYSILLSESPVTPFDRFTCNAFHFVVCRICTSYRLAASSAGAVYVELIAS